MAANVDRSGRLRRIASWWLWLSVCVAVSGCDLPERLSAVPENDTTAAAIRGIPNARFFPEMQADLLVQETREAQDRELSALAPHGSAVQLPEADLLAVSGGGADGAFGAGLLTAWSASGTRPVFKVVTGVSTGALTAPFAFLGSNWDKQLTAVYTQIRPSDIFESRFLSAAVWNDALADTSPLTRLISRNADERMLDAIATEYRKGRLLFSGTTDIDAGRPVIWNMGAIAASGQADALDLFRQVLLASAAIPGFFPPVLIDVEVNGRRYQEMHVDGGTFAQIFLYPSGVNHAALFHGIRRRPVRAWLILNGRFHPFWANVDRRTLPIAEEAISSMLQASGMNAIAQLYFASQRVMRALYQFGYEKAKKGDPWVTRPPWFPEGQDTASPALK